MIVCFALEREMLQIENSLRHNHKVHNITFHKICYTQSEDTHRETMQESGKLYSENSKLKRVNAYHRSFLPIFVEPISCIVDCDEITKWMCVYDLGQYFYIVWKSSAQFRIKNKIKTKKMKGATNMPMQSALPLNELNDFSYFLFICCCCLVWFIIFLFL